MAVPVATEVSDGVSVMLAVAVGGAGRPGSLVGLGPWVGAGVLVSVGVLIDVAGRAVPAAVGKFDLGIGGVGISAGGSGVHVPGVGVAPRSLGVGVPVAVGLRVGVVVHVNAVLLTLTLLDFGRRAVLLTA